MIDEYDDNKIYMQFGRIGKQNFNMDVAFPMSIFQAYGIALSSFDFKFACEWSIYYSLIIILNHKSNTSLFPLIPLNTNVWLKGVYCLIIILMAS